MKRGTAFFIVWLFVALFSAGPAWAAIPQLGDANNDGTVDLADAILVLRASSRTDPVLPAGGLGNADFDLDRKIALPEAVFILQALAGLREIHVSAAMRAGRVVLPAGWPAGLPLTSLSVHGELGSSAVSADGSFSVPLSGQGIAVAVVTDAAGTPLMLGYLTDDPGLNYLGVHSTAVALLFQTLGAFTLPRAAWLQMGRLISETPEAAALAATIAGRLIQDPEAISKQDQAIADAVSSATQTIVATLPEGAGLAAALTSRGSVTRRAQSGDVTQVLLEGENPRSGVRILLAPDGSGITARNAFRRHVMVLVYRTGWEDKDGNRHDTPWELIVRGPFEPLVKGAYLGATNSVGGVITSFIDWVNGSGAYAESDWGDDSIELPMMPGVDPDTVAKTFYRIVCIGDHLGHGALPPDLKPVAAEAARVQKAMQALEFFKEFFIPVIFALTPLSSEDEPKTDLPKDEIGAAIDMVNLLTSAVPDFTINYQTGSYRNAVVAVIKALVSNGTLQERVVEKMVEWGVFKACNAATMGVLAKTAKKLQILLQIVDKVAAAFDLGMLINQLSQSNAYEPWQATAVWPQVRIQPNPAMVKPGEDLDLLVTVGGESGNSADYFYKFVWEVDGGTGMLTTDTLEYAATITRTNLSPSAPIIYEASANAQQGDKDTVKVTAYRVNAEGEKKLGDAKATVTIAGSQVTIEPATADVAPEATQLFAARVKDAEAAEGDVYTYQWLNTAQFGHLAGGLDSVESTTATSVTYEAGTDKEGLDSLTLAVYRDRAGTERKLLGQALALINVRKPYDLLLTPAGKGLRFGEAQVFTARVVPELPGATLLYTWDNTATAGTLTDGDGRDHFETPQNSATYTAGQSAGTDTLSIRAERLIGAKRFPVAETQATVAVSSYGVSLPQTLTLTHMQSAFLTATVTPAMPPGGYLRWTGTGQKGTLIDYDSGQTGSFDTASPTVGYSATTFVETGTDTVRVELYAGQGGSAVLLDSAECVVTVNGPVPVTAAVRWSGTVSYNMVNVYGETVSISATIAALCWTQPAGTTDSAIYLNTHGISPGFEYLDGTLSNSVQVQHGFSYEGAQKVSMRSAQCPIMANLPPDVCSQLIAQAVGPGETGRMVAVQVFGGEGYGAALGAGKSHIAGWTFQVKVW